MASDLSTRREDASELAAFADPAPLGDHLDFASFIASARQAREARGLSLAEVAARMGVDHAAVSRLETGRQANPTVNTVMRYAAAIGSRVGWTLCDRDDTPTPQGEERVRRRLRGGDAKRAASVSEPGSDDESGAPGANHPG